MNLTSSLSASVRATRRRDSTTTRKTFCFGAMSALESREAQAQLLTDELMVKIAEFALDKDLRSMMRTCRGWRGALLGNTRLRFRLHQGVGALHGLRAMPLAGLSLARACCRGSVFLPCVSVMDTRAVQIDARVIADEILQQHPKPEESSAAAGDNRGGLHSERECGRPATATTLIFALTGEHLHVVQWQAASKSLRRMASLRIASPLVHPDEGDAWWASAIVSKGSASDDETLSDSSTSASEEEVVGIESTERGSRQSSGATSRCAGVQPLATWGRVAQAPSERSPRASHSPVRGMQHRGLALCLAVAGTTAATGGLDGTVRTWGLRWSVSEDMSSAGLDTACDITGCSHSNNMSGDNQDAACACVDVRIRVTLTPLATIEAHPGAIWSLLHVHGALLSGASDGVVRVWRHAHSASMGSADSGKSEEPSRREESAQFRLTTAISLAGPPSRVAHMHASNGQLFVASDDRTLVAHALPPGGLLDCGMHTQRNKRDRLSCANKAAREMDSPNLPRGSQTLTSAPRAMAGGPDGSVYVAHGDQVSQHQSSAGSSAGLDTRPLETATARLLQGRAVALCVSGSLLCIGSAVGRVTVLDAHARHRVLACWRGGPGLRSLVAVDGYLLSGDVHGQLFLW
jgi:WD40 repeat protein